jgi:hypothetical protein
VREMVENSTLVIVGVLGTLLTTGTAIYFATRPPKDSVPGVPEEVPYEPPVPEVVMPGQPGTGPGFGGLTGGQTIGGGAPVAPAFDGW